MQYRFNTKNVNKKWIGKGTWLYIKDMTRVSSEGFRYYWDKGLDDLDIIICPLTDAATDPFVKMFTESKLPINLGIPFGITGQGQIKIYTNDDFNLWKLTPDRLMSQTFQVLIHELAHYLLYIKDNTTKVKLRHNDTSGHKAGTILDWFSAEVHDLDYENQDWSKIVNWSTSIFGVNKTILLRGIDVRSALIKGP